MVEWLAHLTVHPRAGVQILCSLGVVHPAVCPPSMDWSIELDTWGSLRKANCGNTVVTHALHPNVWALFLHKLKKEEMSTEATRICSVCPQQRMTETTNKLHIWSERCTAWQPPAVGTQVLGKMKQHKKSYLLKFVVLTLLKHSRYKDCKVISFKWHSIRKCPACKELTAWEKIQTEGLGGNAYNWRPQARKFRQFRKERNLKHLHYKEEAYDIGKR